MGRNAQRRRAPKAAAKYQRSLPVESRLRARMAQVQTLAQFEQILADASDDTRAACRRLMTPMLRPNLPCCGPAKLATTLGKTLTAGQHSLYCPTRKTPSLLITKVAD